MILKIDHNACNALTISHTLANIFMDDFDPQLLLMLQYLCQRQQLLLQGLVSRLTSHNLKDCDGYHHNRCMARIHDNTQCTRKWKDSLSQLCGSHLHSLPYGRFMGQDDCHESSVIDMNQYLPTRIINLNGTEYLIDDRQLIFERSELTTIVGRRINETQIEWF